MIESIRRNSTVYVPEITVKHLSDLLLSAIYSKLDESLFSEIEISTLEDRVCNIRLRNAILDEKCFNEDALQAIMTTSTIIYKDPMPCDDLFFGRNVFAVINALSKSFCIEYYNQSDHYLTSWEDGKPTHILTIEEDISSREPYLLIAFEI
jgi:hypothetical protein